MYIELVSRQSFNLYTTVWVKKELFPEFKEILVQRSLKSGSNVKTNCLAISFRIFDQFYCLMNTQFMNGGNLKQKNQEYLDIIENITFSKEMKILDHE